MIDKQLFTKILEEMEKTNLKIAVYGYVYRDRETIAEELNDVIFIKNYNDFLEWHDTLYAIYEYHERPVNILLIQKV